MDYIGNGNPDGTSFGQNTSDLISFYGVTSVKQPSGSAQGAFTKTVTTPAAQTAATVGTTTDPASPGYGFTTTTQANLIIAHCNAAAVDIGVLRAQIVAINADIASLQTWQNKVRTDLVALGLQAGA